MSKTLGGASMHRFFLLPLKSNRHGTNTRFTQKAVQMITILNKKLRKIAYVDVLSVPLYDYT